MTVRVSTPPRDASPPLVLSLDVGSSSVRAIAYDRRALAVEGLEAHRPYHADTDRAGAVEVNADLLVDLVAQCIDIAVKNADTTPAPIAAVACCTFWHSLVGVDQQGRAVTPVYTWADTRSQDAVPFLRARFDEALMHSRTGTMFHTSYWPAKLLWLRERHPDLVRSVRFWMSFGEYLYLQLFGERRVSLSMASGTGLFDPHRNAWDSEWLDALGVSPVSLSPLADVADAQSGLARPWSTRWPSLRSLPWFLPVGDGACNNLGSGAFEDTRAAIMVGTSGAMRVVRDTANFAIPQGLWTYRVDRNRIVQGGALSEGGNVFAWLMETVQHLPIADVEAALADATPDAHGLTVLPFFAGERSPRWRSELRATIHGLSFDTTAFDIVQACLESIALQFSLVYGLLRRDAPRVATIIASGAGLIHSAGWMQMMSDCFGTPLTPCAVPEATSRGAALLALEAMKAISGVAEAEAAMSETLEPRPSYAPVYRAALARQEDLYQRLLRFDRVYPESDRGESAESFHDNQTT